MLIRFEVSNFRSVLEPEGLSMVAIDRDRDAARPAQLLGESLLTVAAVYGANASGKSNILTAYAWLAAAIQDSLRAWDDLIPVETFAFADGPERPTVFAVEVLVEGVRFEYLVELDAEQVYYEALFHYPEKKRRRVFEREGLDMKFQRGVTGVAGTKELLTDRTLVLSAARRFGDPLIVAFASELLSTEVLGIPAQKYRQAPAGAIGVSSYVFRGVPRATRQIFDPSSGPLNLTDMRDRALALLRLADLGIEDVIIDTQERFYPGTEESRTSRRLRLVHRVGDKTAPLDFAAESDGTRAWFGLIGPVLKALDHGSLLLVDEIDASLHPTLSAELIRIFQRPDTNPRGAQIIFSSHDASLLNHLNRDEVWLTEKRDNGSTHLGPLSDFAGERVRRSQNLESAYLHGRFGAVPDLDQTELLRALGLVG